MPSRCVISFNALAISNAWVRLSSAHGPAMTASGSALPNFTLPTATIGAAVVVTPETFLKRTERTMPPPREQINRQ
jgi:hypothetical protein